MNENNIIQNFEFGECWHDSYLENITIEDTDITVKIATDDKTVLLKCKHFLGIEYIGQWDESVIKGIYIKEDCDIITKAKDEIAAHNNIEIIGEGVRKHDSKWICIEIELIDGIVIKIICEYMEAQYIAANV